MIKLENITLDHFNGNSNTKIIPNSKMIKVINDYCDPTSIITSQITIIESGIYSITMFLQSNVNCVWWSSHDNHKNIQLKNGFNNFKISISNSQKNPYLIGIVANKLSSGKILNISNFKITKILNKNNQNTQNTQIIIPNKFNQDKINQNKLIQNKINQNTITKINQNTINKINQNTINKINQNAITKINQNDITKINQNTITKINQNAPIRSSKIEISPVLPNVSVILPTLERVDGFINVVNNFKNQKLLNFEFIAIDDGSTNESYSSKLNYIRQLNDSRFKLLKNEKNMGISYTLNRGINICRGEYVTWISDDNEYYNNYLSTLFDQKYDFIYTYWLMNNVNRNKTIVVKKQYNNVSELLNNFWGMGSFMWKKSLMNKIGFYDELLDGCEDYDYLVRTFLNTNNINHKKITTMKYCLDDNSKFSKTYKNIISLKKEMILVYQYINRINQLKKININYVSEYINSSILDKIVQKQNSPNINIYNVTNISLINKSLNIPLTFKNIVFNAFKNKSNVIFKKYTPFNNSFIITTNASLISELSINFADKLITESIIEEPIKEPVKEVVKEPVKEVIKEPVKEVVKEPVKEVIKEPVKEIIKEPVKEVVKEPIKEIIKEPVKEIIKEPVKEIIKEPILFDYPLNSDNMPLSSKKISIVMSYINRRKQLEFTIKTIKISRHKNIEIIVNDDGSDENELIDDFVEKYGIILIKTDKISKQYDNPVIGYNKAIERATGDIIILQNPEVCYIGDVITYVANNVNDTNYISFSCCTLNNYDMNNTLYELLPNNNRPTYTELCKLLDFELRWYNHPTKKPTHFHFCSALTKNNLVKIRGFSPEFKHGLCFDDDDFILKIKYDLGINMEIIPPNNLFTIHQYHGVSSSVNCDTFEETNPVRRKWELNRDLFVSKKNNTTKINMYKKKSIPKIFNCYWDKTPLSYMAYLAVLSFIYYNPSWSVHVYIPSKKYDVITWVTTEQKTKYIGRDYWDDLIKLPNVKIITMDFKNIGFDNDISEVIKSDYIRWYILSTVGGIWSDMDILYINSLDNTIFNDEKDFDTMIFDINETEQYYPIGFFMASPNNLFFKKLLNLAKTYYDPTKYQSIGATMIKKIWPKNSNIIKDFPNLKLLIEDKYIYLPYEWTELDKLFDYECTENLRKKTIGIHWFNGSESAKNYQNNFDKLLNKNSTISILTNKFMDVYKSDSFCKEIIPINPKYPSNNGISVSIVMAYHNRKKQIITTLDTINMSVYKNLSVVIVDDASDDDQRLEDIIYKYDFDIKLIRIAPEHKTWINPCIAYNIGFTYADGDIIIIQNPEVLHAGDIIKYTVDNLKQDQYLVYSCYASPDFTFNDKLANIIKTSNTSSLKDNIIKNFINEIKYENYTFDWKFYVDKYPDLSHIKTESEALNHWNTIGNRENRQCNIHNIYSPPEYINWKGWYNHPSYNVRPLHFLSATYKNNIIKIRGFDEKYKDGLWYDDDDFLKRMEIITNVSIIPETQGLGIHQYHSGGSAHHIKDNETYNKLVALNKIHFDKLITNIKNKTRVVDREIVPNPYSSTVKYYVFTNKNILNKIIGIAITTYSDEHTSDKRIQIISDSFSSLRENMKNVKVIVVVDGKCIPKHKELLDKYGDVFEIIYRQKNGGISRAKNTCIKYLLQKNIDIGFLADDDIIYNKGWQQMYVSNIIETGIQHFCYWPLNIPATVNHAEYKSTILVKPKNAISGCLMSFTREIIEKVGYFRIYPYIYGYEHEDFTYRCVNNGFIDAVTDVYPSNKYVTLHPDSLSNKSFEMDYEKIELNKKFNEIQNYKDFVGFQE
ncbi:putative glycosyltransferase [Cotonvirus japonicus]|uniref:Glycosyltransferase n=1 Tax=Cotonvirus japonicus TaxID=2811091 RepID=A0ABM7NSQ8_9VIRU|nr:putative glycosyltransferase [Cotonvirus japonicus]BCS83202.1 putative glycosyltransferase [Cotonvirus japonicus]